VLQWPWCNRTRSWGFIHRVYDGSAGRGFWRAVWLWLLALTMYVLALALGCFVFATRDPRKANGAHVAGAWLMEGFGGLLKLLLLEWWIWW